MFSLECLSLFSNIDLKRYSKYKIKFIVLIFQRVFNINLFLLIIKKDASFNNNSDLIPTRDRSFDRKQQKLKKRASAIEDDEFVRRVYRSKPESPPYEEMNHRIRESKSFGEGINNLPTNNFNTNNTFNNRNPNTLDQLVPNNQINRFQRTSEYIASLNQPQQMKLPEIEPPSRQTSTNNQFIPPANNQINTNLAPLVDRNSYNGYDNNRNTRVVSYHDEEPQPQPRYFSAAPTIKWPKNQNLSQNQNQNQYENNMNYNSNQPTTGSTINMNNSVQKQSETTYNNNESGNNLPYSDFFEDELNKYLSWV